MARSETVAEAMTKHLRTQGKTVMDLNSFFDRIGVKWVGQPTVISPTIPLSVDLARRFPEAAIELRRADDPQGYYFLNISLDEKEVAVEWKASEGFGLSFFDESSKPLEGLFQPPQEKFTSPEAVYFRIVGLLAP